MTMVRSISNKSSNVKLGIVVRQYTRHLTTEAQNYDSAESAFQLRNQEACIASGKNQRICTTLKQKFSSTDYFAASV